MCSSPKFLIFLYSPCPFPVPIGGLATGASSRGPVRVFRNPSIATSIALESLNLDSFQLRHVVYLLSRDILILPHLLRVDSLYSLYS
jgi:hypothetical protein